MLEIKLALGLAMIVVLTVIIVLRSIPDNWIEVEDDDE